MIVDKRIVVWLVACLISFTTTVTAVDQIAASFTTLPEEEVQHLLFNQRAAAVLATGSSEQEVYGPLLDKQLKKLYYAHKSLVCAELSVHNNTDSSLTFPPQVWAKRLAKKHLEGYTFFPTSKVLYLYTTPFIGKILIGMMGFFYVLPLMPILIPLFDDAWKTKGGFAIYRDWSCCIVRLSYAHPQSGA